MERNWKSNGGPSLGERELIVWYPAPAVRFGVDFVIVGVTAALVVLPALFCLWLLVLCVNHLLILAGWGLGDWRLIHDETSWIPVAGAGLALLFVTLLLGPLIAWVAVRWWRRLRRTWWLRLSNKGFEVNDRTFTPPRCYEWDEIDQFMLVAAAGHVEDAPVARPKTYSEAFRDGVYTPPTMVGFHCVPDRRRRRSLASKLLFNATSRDGTKADGSVMGYWDRPLDEAVDLLNEWLVRYRST